jgi:hypothetical protein
MPPFRAGQRRIAAGVAAERLREGRD